MLNVTFVMLIIDGKRIPRTEKVIPVRLLFSWRGDGDNLVEIRTLHRHLKLYYRRHAHIVVDSIITETIVQPGVEHTAAAEIKAIALELSGHHLTTNRIAVIQTTDENHGFLRNNVLRLQEFLMIALTQRISWLCTLVSWIIKQQLTE